MKEHVIDIGSKIIENYGNVYVWRTRIIPYFINDSFDISEHVFIYVENKITKDCELSVFNDFLTDEYYSKSEDTISCELVRKPCTHLCMFLNYIFKDRTNPLKSIKQLKYEDVNCFLNEYSNGNIGQDTKSFKDGNSVREVKRTIDAFGYWLSRKNIGRDKVVPYFKQKDFNKVIEVRQYEHGKTRKVSVYKTPFSVKIHGKIRREKVKEVQAILLLCLLHTANHYDKMLTLPIALQAFAGLREGEVMQLCKERITLDKPSNILEEFSIDLWQEKIIRDDGKITGHIKIPRDQCVYYSFLSLIDKYYKEHMLLLKEKGYSNDEYGAMFFNKRGQAMISDNYEDRFRNIVAKTIKLLSALSNYGLVEASNVLSVLHKASLTPHSMRYFFTGFITEKCNGNPFEIAVWRGDSNIQSALTYLRQHKPTREKIRETQDEFQNDYKKYMQLIKAVKNDAK